MDFVKLLSSKLLNIDHFQLLYRASEHEYSAEKFHQLCDGHGPTLIIIENQFGNVFGGYTKVKWTKGDIQFGGYVENVERDETAFLFVIRSKNKLQKVPDIFEYQKHQHGDYAVAHNEGYGPIFGNAPSIKINDKCNVELSWSFIPKDHERGFMSYNHNGQELCGGWTASKRPSMIDSYGFNQRYFIEDYEVFGLK